MNQSILIIDDIEENRKYLSSVIKTNREYNVYIASNGFDVLVMLEKQKIPLPDIILLDIMMPEMSGFELAEKLKSKPETAEIPIIFVTALTDTENIIAAFKRGGVDYITKPFKKEELLTRLDMQLKLLNFHRELKEKNRLLESKKELLIDMVETKTRKIEQLTFSMVCALEHANLLHDTDTGNHIKRVSSYSQLLASEYGCDVDFVQRIKMFASLHDVGKVGIPDSILKKPGRYTTEEFEQMKQHVHHARDILAGNDVDVMACNIAVYHHEKWDGTGYLEQLKGETIPLEARIVALADVYDALISRRPYKDVYEEEKADKIIHEESGKHFDPELVKLFFRIKDKILEVKEKFR